MSRLLVLLTAVARTALALGQDATVPVPEPYDVVVYGGTPGGIAAAVSAAREGARTLLLEPTRHIGGITTSGLTATEAHHMNLKTFGGFWLEYYRRLGARYGRTQLVFSHEKKAYSTDELHFANSADACFEPHQAEAVFAELLREAGVTVRLETRLREVSKKDRRIVRLRLSGGPEVAARVFVDASYEGDLMARAGVSYTYGREGRDTYGESLAGVRLLDAPVEADPFDDDGTLLPGIRPREAVENGQADRRVMTYSVRPWLTRREDNKVPLEKPAGYDPRRYRLLARFLAGHPHTKLRELVDFYSRPNEKFELNNKQNAIISLGLFGGNVDYPDADEARRSEIVRDHNDWARGLLWFLGHDPVVPEALRRETLQWGLPKDEFVDNGHWPYQVYVREARRMIGRTVVTERNVRDQRTQPDSIGLGSHFIDSHHVQRVAVSRTQFANEGRLWMEGNTYEIPLRSVTPKEEECTNLLVPVAASFSHVAFCTYRVEPTWMMVGQASGIAAARAAREGKSVQGLDVPSLQARLRETGLVVDLAKAQ